MHTRESINYLSLFSGIGTAEKGIEQAYERSQDHQNESAQSGAADSITGRFGIANQYGNSVLPTDHSAFRRNAECIGFAEIDRYASAIYRYHWPNVPNIGDATRIVPKQLTDFDFLVAGFPCQSFSIAGKRQGFNEARGTLFFEIARILSHKRPGHFVLENVKGLLSADNGKVYTTILRILADLNYRVETVVLNSKHYGVPQNRERVFFIGHLADGCSGEILSFGESCRGIIESRIVQLNKPKHSNNRVYADSGASPTLNTAQGGNRQPFVAIPVLTPERATKRQNGRRFKDDGDDAFTLTSQDRHGVFNGKRIRRLTEIECERLQGLPDDFTKYGDFNGEIKEISATQRYKTLGNAMTVDVVEALVSRMIEKKCLTQKN